MKLSGTNLAIVHSAILCCVGHEKGRSMRWKQSLVMLAVVNMLVHMLITRQNSCVFCEKGNDKLHQLLQSDDTVRSIAKDLQDTSLLRIEDGDLIALEAKYHWGCLINLRNHYWSSYTRDIMLLVNLVKK